MVSIDRMVRKAAFYAATTLAIFALLGPVASDASAQTPWPLQPLADDRHSLAFWINDLGEVAGTSFTPGVSQSAVLWGLDGEPMALPPLEGDQFQTSIGRGNSINNRGQIGGTSLGGSGGSRAVVWDRIGTIIRVLPPLPGGTSSAAVAISAPGWVVGQSRFPGIEGMDLVWDQQGTPTLLPPLPDDIDSVALAINPRGQIVGASGVDLSPFGTPVAWDRYGTPTALPLLPGDYEGLAFSINAGGKIVGVSSGSNGDSAVVWDLNGTPTELPPLPGDDESTALAINPRGEIVGMSVRSDGLNTAVVWDYNGTPTPLLPLPGDLQSQATGINGRGDVVGASIGSVFTAVVWWR